MFINKTDSNSKQIAIGPTRERHKGHRLCNMMSSLVTIWHGMQEGLTAWTGWPRWALDTVQILLCLNAIVASIDLLLTSQNTSATAGESGKMSPTSSGPTKSERKAMSSMKKFRLFQLKYLSVYFVIMLADWLQGTNMYTLYMSYGVDVGTLFLTGFLSSAVFGTFLGIFVDSWGRRLGCIVFCLLEIVINLMEHVSSMPVLLVGRVLGGLSTSLLFSAFESWMVSEHRKQRFSEDLLGSTFSICSWGNGLMAILAGFVAQIASDKHGDIGPFQYAIALTVAALAIIVVAWGENFGDNNSNSSKEDQSFMQTLRSSFRAIRLDYRILLLGLSQAAFEGAVYSFVFMWVPSLLLMYDSGEALPTGLIFACFMLAMTFGGMLFNLLLPLVIVHPPVAATTTATTATTATASSSQHQQQHQKGVHLLNIAIYCTSAAAMAVPLYTFTFAPVFIAFLVLETMLGMFNSVGGTLRSAIYPETFQSSLISIFRLPLNLLVVIGTNLANSDSDGSSSVASRTAQLQRAFLYLLGLHLVAMLLQCLLYFISDSGSAPAITNERSSSASNSNKSKAGSNCGNNRKAKKN